VRSLNATNCTVTTGGCVPINLFGAPGSITPQQLAFLAIPTFQTATTRQEVIAGNFAGEIDLIKSPLPERQWGWPSASRAGPVSVATDQTLQCRRRVKC